MLSEGLVFIPKITHLFSSLNGRQLAFGRDMDPILHAYQGLHCPEQTRNPKRGLTLNQDYCLPLCKKHSRVPELDLEMFKVKGLGT